MMKRVWPIVFLSWFLVVLGASAYYAWSAGFSPGEYPGVYNSWNTSSSLLQSDVISARPSNIGACEFFNNTGANGFFMVYNSPTVAGQTAGKMIGWCVASSMAGCSVTAGGPTGPTVNAAIMSYNGLSWFGSSTFPAQTGFGSNGMAICTYNNR